MRQRSSLNYIQIKLFPPHQKTQITRQRTSNYWNLLQFKWIRQIKTYGYRKSKETMLFRQGISAKSNYLLYLEQKGMDDHGPI